jgi:hypothetical protein
MDVAFSYTCVGYFYNLSLMSDCRLIQGLAYLINSGLCGIVEFRKYF